MACRRRVKSLRHPTDCVEVKKMKRCKLLALVPLLLLALASCNRDPKVQAQRYLENGNKFFAKDKFKEASIMYRRALQKDMRFGEAYYRLALANLKLGAYGDAAKMLRYAVELQPENSDAITKLADLYMLASTQQQDTKGAERLLKETDDLAAKLVAQNPNSFDGHRIYGQLALLHKDPQTAVKEFAIANQQRPNQTDVVLGYFNALVADNQFEVAEKLAKALIQKEKTYSPIYDLLYLQYVNRKRLDDAEEVYKLKVQNNPTNANYMLQLAGHYFLSNRRADMDAVMQKLTDSKQFPDGYLLAGDFYFFRLREFDHAQQEYEAAIKAFPKDKALYEKRLVELFANTGKKDQANQLLASILKDNPKDADAVAMRAALMLTTGNRDQINMAANDLQSLVSKTPSNYIFRFNYARALVAQGELDKAHAQLEEAIKLRTDLIAARELMARIDLAKGDAPKALQEAEDTLKLDRNDLSAHLSRSSALLMMGERDKAHDELDSILHNYPENAEARYQVGYLAWQEKDYQKAGQVFGDLYKANPNDMRGLVGVVETMASENHLDEAIKQVEKAIQAEPDRAGLKLTRANLLVRAQRYDEGLAGFQDLLAKEPNSSDLLFRIAETYRLKGDLNQAMDYFRKASQAAPNDTLSLMQLSLLLEGTGKREQAKPIYEQILKLQPDHPVALNNLAYIKAEEGTDLDDALTMAQRARQKMPNNPAIADTLGWIYLKKNLTEDAIRVLTDLVQQQPKNPIFRYHYGMALLQKGDRASAKRELETAMHNNPSKDDADKIRDLLTRL
jgi:tetratricopeptide (TPR) repeat protein